MSNTAQRSAPIALTPAQLANPLLIPRSKRRRLRRRGILPPANQQQGQQQPRPQRRQQVQQQQQSRQRRSMRPAMERQLVPASTRRRPLAGRALDLPYITCRVNPWMGMKSTGIPDDTDVPRIVVDHRFIQNFTFGSTGIFNIVMLPTFPTCLYAQAASGDTSFIIGGVTPSSNVGQASRFFAAGILPEWSALSVSNLNSGGNYDQAGTYLFAVRARIVTMAMRVFYTGSAVQNQGYIKVNRDQFSVSPQASNRATFTVYGGSGTNVGYNVDQIMFCTMNYTPNFQTIQPDGYQGRLEHGAYVLVKHNSPKYRWVDVNRNVTLLTDTLDTVAGYNMPLGSASPSTVSGTGHMAFVDQDWSATSVFISGGSTGQTFVVEVIACIEYELDTQSPVSQLAGQPKTDMRAVEAAAQAAKSHTTVATTEPSTFDNLVNVAKQAASALSVGASFAKLAL